MTTSESNPALTGRRAALFGQVFSAVCFLAALAAAPYFDSLTRVLLVLSTFLFAIVCRYSVRYMMGDPGQARFTFWLTLTGLCVFALVLAGNLLLFAAAWCGISLSLHQLLQFYSNRPGAILAARKKFLISRLGDAALALALVLTYRQFGSWEFREIFAAADTLRAAGPEHLPAGISWICGALVFAALLKSAQFPFHSWLPDTMETPTPVSALMHAGVINAGGILIIRLSPLVSLSDFALFVLAITGGFTALFASFTMLTQASVKRCLAFSTVAQMGFMMLECGLGAFHLALLHLVAHSLYKAHAFLSTGSVVAAPAKDSWSPVHPAAAVLCSLTAFAVSLGAAFALGVDPLDQPLLTGIFSLALAQLFCRAGASPDRAWRFPAGLAAGAVLAVAYFALERLAGLAVAPLRTESNWYGLPVLALFLLFAVVQTQVPRLAGSSFAQKLFVHARNGFYFNTLANRFTRALWPLKVPQEGI